MMRWLVTYPLLTIRTTIMILEERLDRASSHISSLIAHPRLSAPVKAIEKRLEGVRPSFDRDYKGFS